MPEADLRSLRDHVAGSAADDRAEDLTGDRADLELLPLRRLRRAVPQHDVRELVRHHAGDFTFGSRRLDHSAIQEHRSAGQRKRVDVAQVDDVEGVAERRLAELTRYHRDEPLADILDELFRALVVEQRHLLTDLTSRLASELDVLLWLSSCSCGGVIFVCAAADPAISSTASVA